MSVLFIGNFLSVHRGTIGPMEGVMDRLKGEIKVYKASVYDNKALKFVDMLFKSLFYPYNTIHIDTYSSDALIFARFCAAIGKARRKKVALNLRGGGLYVLYQTVKEKKKVIEKLFSFATVIVTPSRYLQEMFGKEGFGIDYLPNTIDYSKFPFSHEIVDNHKLLWVRAFNSTYQPWLAVKTLYEVRKKYPDATLTMIGPDKGLLNETKMLVSELGLDPYVFFVGKVPNSELSSYYTSHQVFLNTTNTESFGVAVMEAASCGIPVVSTSAGELPFLWTNEENALLIYTFDEKDFANAVCRLFEDKGLYLKLKEKARNMAASFDWAAVKGLWIDLLT